MRRFGGLILVGTAMFWLPALAVAADGLSSEQLKRMYDDTVVQLRTAQDRRNELARENEKLQARIAQLEKELEQTRENATAVADKTFQARAERAAFAEFLRSNPAVRLQWQAYLQQNLLGTPEVKDPLDRDWPLPGKP